MNNRENNVYDLNYFVFRMRRSGYITDVIIRNFSEKDKRKFMVVVGKRGCNVFITCYKDNTFHFYDGLQFIKSNVRIKTESMETILYHLQENGIIEKSNQYGIERPTNEEESNESEIEN